MKHLRKLLLPLQTLVVLPICCCANSPKGLPNINIVKHEHITISYSTPNQKQDFICTYKLDDDYLIGDIRVWNKNSTLGEQEITQFITHNPNSKTITIPAAKFWNYEYIKLDVNVIKTLKM